MKIEADRLHGLLAVFEEAEALIDAARMARKSGYRKFDAFAPFPVEGLAEAMEFKPAWVAPLCWVGGFAGAAIGFGWQVWDTVAAFPLNVGGRPFFSWPAYVPIAFELMILFAGTFTFFGVLLLNRLPRLYHPLFNVEEFQRRNSSDGFFLLIEAADPLFSPDLSRRFLLSLGPVRIHEVPDEP